jgi:enterochelin esterase-like enzyme
MGTVPVSRKWGLSPFFSLSVAIFCATAFAQTPPPAPTEDVNQFYEFSPDSLAKVDVPKGVIDGPFKLPSQAYPGTLHDYWVYVPAQYDKTKPAALMVFNDGQAFMHPEGDVRAPDVLDNLIVRREIPVMIAVFINPGRTPEQPMATLSDWGDRGSNRPTEYNTLDDKYSRVIVDELLPVIYGQYNVSRDPAMHGIGGSSSGAIAAFTVAWQRSEAFRKVLSNVGSFVNLRGGDAYADIVRKAKKKPLRIFMVDGRNDNRQRRDGAYDPRWDWFLQNLRLQKALEEKGYDLNYSWGMQRHGQKMLRTVMPEMMRWLWRDHAVSGDPNDLEQRAFARDP